MKKIILLLSMSLMMSCNTVSTYYQVFKTNSKTVQLKDNNALVFEDSSCKISYNLWGKYGNAGFSFYNKTNETIYLLLDDSFYVINGNAYDYFQNRIFSNSSNASSTATSSSSQTLWSKITLTNFASNTVTANNTSGVEIIEQKTIAIPANTSKTISEFDINQTTFRDCDLIRYPSSKQISSKSFTEENTPIKFYNSITYKQGDKISKVKNDFYVSNITNIAEKDILKYEKNDFCNQKNISRYKVFKESTPDKFYTTYIKSQTDNWKY